ncbi:hypothetical protein, partial [Roseomonas rosulenta]|uniref:hypothetical protein n=1 Tax=Roseomonas rosulenta TaxID=2748667 RepID=UPI001E3FE5DC
VPSPGLPSAPQALGAVALCAPGSRQGRDPRFDLPSDGGRRASARLAFAPCTGPPGAAEGLGAVAQARDPQVASMLGRGRSASWRP